jgi:DNA repair exonuclease SbcCD ATPase subunit
MKLDKLKLKNWAGHKEKDITLEGNIVGFTGANGAGKTTLLTGIAYCLRGTLPQKKTASDYIRHFGLPGGAKSAEIEAQFTRQSESFTISRTLAVKGSERLLTLSNGNTYTYADQVDEQIGNILGTDVSTLENILYIPQGDLKNILFGTAAEQEKLLIKILDIGHLQEAYKAIAAKINNLSARIDPMLNSRIQTLEEQIDLKINEGKAIEAELNNLPKIEHESLSNAESLLLMLENLDIQLRHKSMDMLKIKEKLNSLNGNNQISEIQNRLLLDSGKSDINGLIINLQSKEKVLTGTIISTINMIKDNLEKLKKCEDELSSTSPEVRSLLTEFCKICPVDNFTLAAYEAYIDSRDRLIPEAVQRLELYKAKEAELQEKIQKKRDKYSILNAEIKAMHIYAEASDCQDLNCTVCGSVVPEQVVKAQKQKLEELQQGAATLLESGKQFSGELTFIQGDIASTSQRLNALRTTTQIPDNICEFIAKNVIIKEYLGRANNINNSINRLILDIATHEDQTARLVQSLVDTAKSWDLVEIRTNVSNLDLDSYKQYVDGVVAQVRKEIESLKSQSVTQVTEEERKLVEAFQKATEESKVAEAATSFVAEQIAQTEERLIALLASLPLDLDAIPQMRDRVKSLREFFDKKDFHNQSLGINKAVCDNLNRDLTMLLKQKEEVGPILAVIEELTLLKDQFSREGIPQAYVTAKFENLIQTTKENLQKLNVQFEIRQDEDNPLRFQFKRHDTGEDYWLPQGHMSGGQRVRLCLAFIMAVQQVLVPNLGFIILDEPSNHVDETGVDDLRDFLVKIRPELEAADMQLIICDHKETLSSAYTTSIRL